MYLLDKMLSRIVRDGELVLTDPAGRERRYGAPAAGRTPVRIRVADSATAYAIGRAPALGAGEAWMDGRLTLEGSDSILGLLDLIAFNLRWDFDNKSRVALWAGQAIGAWVDQRNYSRRAKRNVAHHYDLSDALYDLFLDADRQYSCAYFTDPAHSLDQAQADKKAHIAAKLAIAPGMRVLDIGCGWGGLALYLHNRTGADVTGITLSEHQLRIARERAAAAGVSQHVRFELVDYRAVEGRFDRIVSVGMFEHVGRPHYRTFFERVRDLLAPDGVALLHTIGRADGPGATDPWTAKYIFPGGYSPALSEIVPAIERSYLWITDIEVLRLHYMHTLEHWYARVLEQRAAIEALYDARFWRMWTFYLAGAITAFRHDGHVNFQIQLTRRRDALPITRDYMAAAESLLRG